MARKDISSDASLGEQTLDLLVPRLNKEGFTAQIDDTLAMILMGVVDLYQTHREEIAETLESSDNKKLTLNLKSVLDFSDAAPSVDVGIRFSSSITDRRTYQGDSPDQGQLPLAEAPVAEVPANEESAGSPDDLAEGEEN